MGDPVRYSELRIGDKFGRRMTVTDTHLTLAATLFADSVPIHVDEKFAKNTPFGTRIAPGPVASGLLAVSIGMHFAGTALAYLEQVDQYRKPLKAGDTVSTVWEVVEKIDKPRFNGGIVVLKGVCTNQEGEVVLESTGKSIVTDVLPGEESPDIAETNEERAET